MGTDRQASVLLVSATYAVAENAKKLNTIGERCNLTLVTVDNVVSVQSGLAASAPVAIPNVGRIHRLQPVGRPGSTTKYWMKGLADIFRSRAFDIIFVEAEPWAVIRWQCWWFKKRYQPQAKFGEFTWENLERPKMKQWLLDWSYRLAGFTADFIVCGSESARNLVRSKVNGPSLYAVPQLGVDESLFYPISVEQKKELRVHHGLDPNTCWVGFCGRFSFEKGVLDLVDAMRSLSAAQPQVRCAFLGKGPLEAEIRSRLGAAAVFLPPLPHDRVNEFMQMLDVLVLPSRTIRTWQRTWQEQFGHVLIEAMSCGVPVIGSRSGAIPEVIGDAGLLVEEGGVQDLQKAIKMLVGDDLLRFRLGDQARQRVLRLFSNAAIGRIWSEVFLKAIKK